MKDKLDITLKIADVELPFNISRDEEEMLRQVAKEVNHAYKKYSEMFADSPSEENLAKVTLLFAKGFIQLRRMVADMDSTLQAYDDRLSDLLREV